MIKYSAIQIWSRNSFRSDFRKLFERATYPNSRARSLVTRSTTGTQQVFLILRISWKYMPTLHRLKNRSQHLRSSNICNIRGRKAFSWVHLNREGLYIQSYARTVMRESQQLKWRGYVLSYHVSLKYKVDDVLVSF